MFGKLALSWVAIYMGLGIYQHLRVTEAGEQLAAERAVEQIESGMVIGLGSGSTATRFIAS